MSTESSDNLKASIAKLISSQQALLDLKIWVPLQAIEAQLKAAVESIKQLQAYRGQIEDHKQIIDDAFKEVQKDSSDIIADVDEFKAKQAQQEAKEEADPKDVCKFNVGGQVFKTRKETLLKCPDSRLVEMMKEAEVRGGDLEVNRDPERFRHVLNFLRDDFKVPKLSVDKLAEVIEELRFWEVEHPIVTDLNSLLFRDPKEDRPGVHLKALAKWRKLGPLSVDEVLAKAGKSFVEGFPIEEKKEKYCIHKSQTNPETKKPCGIGRYVYDLRILEGFFEGDSRNGWVRQIRYDEEYYIGHLKDNQYHGQGKYVYPDGSFEEGQWERNIFKG